MSERIQAYVDQMEDQIKAIAKAALDEWVETPTPIETFESLVASGVAAAVQTLMPSEEEEQQTSHMSMMGGGTLVAREAVRWKIAARTALEALDRGIDQQIDCSPEFTSARNKLAEIFDEDTKRKKEAVYKSAKEVFNIDTRFLDGEELTATQHQTIGVLLVATAMHVVIGFLFDVPKPDACKCLACRSHRALTGEPQKMADIFAKAVEVHGSYQGMIEALGMAYIKDMIDNAGKDTHDKIDPESAKGEVDSLFTRLLSGAPPVPPTEG